MAILWSGLSHALICYRVRDAPRVLRQCANETGKVQTGEVSPLWPYTGPGDNIFLSLSRSRVALLGHICWVRNNSRIGQRLTLKRSVGAEQGGCTIRSTLLPSTHSASRHPEPVHPQKNLAWDGGPGSIPIPVHRSVPKFVSG